MGRAEVNWVEWFSASDEEAAHFERTRLAMKQAGMCTDPETVIEIARYVLKDSGAPSRLRKLADVWESRADAGDPLELIANG